MIAWKDKENAVRALEKKGKVDPAELIEVARDPSHPCHADFTWDVDTAAAERWRDQARLLIRRCKFEVIVDDVTQPIVRYVESPEDDKVFSSLPKIRSTSKVSSVMLRELSMLHGNAARVCGIATSKAGIVGDAVVIELRSIRDQVAFLKDSLSE